MRKRSGRRMAALLAKVDKHLGTLDGWPEAALVKLEAWVNGLDLRWIEMDQKSVRQDDESD